MEQLNFLLQPDLPQKILRDTGTQSLLMEEEIKEVEELALLLIDEIERKQREIDELYERLQSQQIVKGDTVQDTLRMEQKEVEALKAQLASLQSLLVYVPFLFYLKILHNDPNPTAKRNTAKGLWTNVVLAQQGDLFTLLKTMSQVAQDPQQFVQKAIQSLNDIQARLLKSKNPISLRALRFLEKEKIEYVQALYQTMFEFGVPLAIAHAKLPVADEKLVEITKQVQEWGHQQSLDLDEDLTTQFTNHSLFLEAKSGVAANYDQLRVVLDQIPTVPLLPSTPDAEEVNRVLLRQPDILV